MEHNPCGVGIPYVGRQDMRSEVKECLKSPKGRVVQICAGPMVGKSSFAKQIISELKEESQDWGTDLRIAEVALRGKNANAFNVVRMQIAKSFGIPNEDPFDVENFEYKLQRLARENDTAKSHFIVFFDDCDSMAADGARTKFLGLVSSIVHCCVRTRVLLTTRVEFKLPRLGNAVKVVRLPLHTEEEAIEIPRKASPNVEYGTHAQYIIRKCCCLPLILIIVARTLEERRTMLSPQELCELLETFPLQRLKPDLSPDEDNLECIVGKFVACLDDYLQRLLAIYSYFPGTFTTEAAAYVAQYRRKSEAKIFSILPLYDRSMADYNQEKQRYSVFPILRHFVNKNLPHLRHTDSVRLRFVQFYGKLLDKANSYLYNHPPETAFGQVYEDLENVEHLLREAMHSTEDLFKINMKVLRNAHEIILGLSPESAVTYNRNCLEAAEKFGTDKEKSFVLANLGCVVGYSQGDGLKTAMRYLKQAEGLAGGTDGYQGVKLMSHMEWNYYRQGKLKKAKKYQEMALSVVPAVEDRVKVTRIQISVRSHLALVQNFSGNHEEANKLLIETMKFVQEHCPYHPAIRIMLNSLGLTYSQTLALKFFNEALAIREKISWNHPDTAYVLWEMGMCFRRGEMYEKALEYLRNALTIYQACIPTHFVLVEVMSYIAKCYELLDEPQQAIDFYQLIVKNRNTYQQHATLERVVLLSIGRLLALFELSGDQNSLLKTIKEMTVYLKEMIASIASISVEKRLEISLIIYHEYLTEWFSSVDVLECIARCYEELNQPLEALKFYERIIDGRGRFCRETDLPEVILLAFDKLLALTYGYDDQPTLNRIAGKLSEYLKRAVKSTEPLNGNVTMECNIARSRAADDPSACSKNTFVSSHPTDDPSDTAEKSPFSDSEQFEEA